MRRDVEEDRRRRRVMHAVTLDAPRPLGATRSSFAAVVEDHLDDVYGYLLYLTKNWAVAEDLTSETFEAALGKWRRFDPGRGTARAWLLAIARSTALDWFRADSRRRKREERSFAAEPTPDEELSFGERLGVSPHSRTRCSRCRPASGRSSSCGSYSTSKAKRPLGSSASRPRPSRRG